MDIRAKSTTSSSKVATSPAESVPIPTKPVTAAAKPVPNAVDVESSSIPGKVSQTPAAKPSHIEAKTAPTPAKSVAVPPKPVVDTPVVSPTKPAVNRGLNDMLRPDKDSLKYDDNYWDRERGPRKRRPEQERLMTPTGWTLSKLSLTPKNMIMGSSSTSRKSCTATSATCGPAAATRCRHTGRRLTTRRRVLRFRGTSASCA